MSGVEEPREPPDLPRLRNEFESEKSRVLDAGDPDSIQRLAELERKAADPSFWDTAPSALEQLSDHLKQLGIK